MDIGRPTVNAAVMTVIGFREKGRTMRSVTMILAAAACLVGLVPSAYATPTTGSFEQEITYVDDGATAACGFTVTFHQLDRGTYQLFFDQQGDLTRVQVQTLVNGTATANGITLLVHGRENNFYDVVTGTLMDASLELRVWLPGLGVVIMDTGRLLFDADGDVVFEGGPHAALEGDFAALCAALTPAEAG